MAPYDPNIVEIEQYLRGLLTPAARESFERRLSDEAGLREEVAAYGQVLSGLEAMRSEAFAGQLRSWEDALDREESEDIERYLLGTAQAEARAQVESRRREDPDYARRVEQTRILLDGFDAIRAEDFSTDLRRWEGEMPEQSGTARIRRLRPLTRIAVAAGFLLIVLAGLRWYATANYGNEALVAAYYEAPATEATMGEDASTETSLTLRFQVAHDLLRAGAYPEAATTFAALRQQLEVAPVDEFTRQYLMDNATYNHALSLLGARAPDAEIRGLLQSLITNKDSDYREEATRLLRQLDSFWRKAGR